MYDDIVACIAYTRLVCESRECFGITQTFGMALDVMAFSEGINVIAKNFIQLVLIVVGLISLTP